MATSGTVSETIFTTRKVVDHAFRQCRLTPQQITSEHLQTALELLYLFLSTLSNKGIALWAVQKHLIPLYENEGNVPCPLGTVDLLNANLRSLTRITGTASSSEGTAANAFDGDLETACIETTPAGYIQLAFDGEMTCSSFGIMPNSTGTWSIKVQTSTDGTTFTDVYTNTDFLAVRGEWQWFDVEGILNVNYVRLRAVGSTVLNVTEFFIGNLPNEIPMAPLNRDDYTNLPNKSFSGRPVQYFYDKQRRIPYMSVWPVPAAQYTFSQVIIWTQRYIQDVGSLKQELEIPQNWYWTVVTQLAWRLSKEIKEVDRELAPELKQDATEALAEAWTGQTGTGPTFLRPNIGPYTR